MATVRLYRDRWVVDFRDQHGRRCIERPKGPFENKAQERRAAQQMLAKRLGEVARGDYTAQRARLTFAQACDRYIETKVNIRESTRRDYLANIDLYLRPYFGVRKIAEIALVDVERFRHDLATGLPRPILEAFARRYAAAKPALSEARAKQRAARHAVGLRTINKSLVILGAVFKYAEKHGWVDRNPARYVEKLRPAPREDAAEIDQNVLTPSEVCRLIDAAEPAKRNAEGDLISINYRMLIKAAILTGLREGELFGLQWGDVDWNSREVFVRRAFKDGAYHEPKTSTSRRRVDLPDLLVKELKEWRLACPKGAHDLVFPNLDGKPLQANNVLTRGFYPALRRAGLRRIRFHDLRHTFASLHLANGEDIARVSRLLGHASLAVTLNVYAHMLPKEHHGSANRLAAFAFGDTEQVSATTSV